MVLGDFEAHAYSPDVLRLQRALLADDPPLVPGRLLLANSGQVWNEHDGSSDQSLPATQPTGRWSSPYILDQCAAADGRFEPILPNAAQRMNGCSGRTALVKSAFMPQKKFLHRKTAAEPCQ